VLLRLRTKHGEHLPREAYRLLDWAVASLCILPQLLLTAYTSARGVSQPIDPLDALNGAETFGKFLANWFFAHLCLRIHSTHPLPSGLALAVMVALMSCQGAVSVVPDLEFPMYRKGCLSGLVGGYLLEHGLRSRFLWARTSAGSSRVVPPVPPRSGTADSVAVVDVTNAADAASGMEDVAMGAGERAGTARPSRHPLMLSFSSRAAEAQYRHSLFEQSYMWLASASGVVTAMHVAACLEGQAEWRESLIVVSTQNTPRIVRAFVHRQGDTPAGARRFRLFFWLFSICLLLFKVYWPTQSSSGMSAGDTSLEVWLFAQPFFMRIQGPDVRFSWALSALAIYLSHVAPARTWRQDVEAEGSAMRSAVIAGEIAAYLFDWAVRGQFLSSLQSGRPDLEQAKPCRAVAAQEGQEESKAARAARRFG